MTPMQSTARALALGTMTLMLLAGCNKHDAAQDGASGAGATTAAPGDTGAASGSMSGASSPAAGASS
jgi:hypothetical protein